jgi:hypothetical protein
MTLQTRFWSKVKRRDESQCWEWQAGLFTSGYGQFKLAKKPVKAHRVAWMLTYGHLDDDLCVLHRCDNPKCCNPAHLFTGTRADNGRDCALKDRTAHGATHPNAKLNGEQAREIVKRKAEGMSVRAIAREFGVNHWTVTYVLRGATWRREVESD